MTKELLPGLGSGALREALDRLIDAGEDLRYDEYGVLAFPVGHLARKWDDAKDALVTALSLSSPIEPPRSVSSAWPPPTPQASSEIRDNPFIRLQIERIKHVAPANVSETRIWWNCKDCLRCEIEKLTAPSRQGAAKRVEG